MIEQDPNGFPDFVGALPHQVFLEMAWERELVNITMTSDSRETENRLCGSGRSRAWRPEFGSTW